MTHIEGIRKKVVQTKFSYFFIYNFTLFVRPAKKSQKMQFHFLNVSLIPACRINTLLIYLPRLYLLATGAGQADNLICPLPQNMSGRGDRGEKCFNFICTKIRVKEHFYVTSRIFFPYSSVAKVNKIHYEFLIMALGKGQPKPSQKNKKKAEKINWKAPQKS